MEPVLIRIGIKSDSLFLKGPKEVSMIAQVLQPKNLYKAYQRVVSNKGPSGVDGMKVVELKAFIDFNRDQMTQSILNGSYRPKAIKDERKIPTKEDECQGDIQMSEPRSGWVGQKATARYGC